MNLDTRYHTHFTDLNPNDHAIYQYIRNHREECQQLSINALAERCHVSRTTILRFTKKLGFQGFAEMKVLLRQERPQPAESASGIKQVVAIYNDVIQGIYTRDCWDVFQYMDQANRLYIYSNSMAQSTIAREIKRIFLNAQKLFFEIKGRTETQRVLESITPQDMVFILSHTGESQETLAFARKLRLKDIPTVSITTVEENELAHLSTINLHITNLCVEKSTLNSDYVSVSPFFLLVEMLFLKYLDYREAQNES